MFEIYQEGDVVWVQDYHLMLLPAMLKKQHPKMKVGHSFLSAAGRHLHALGWPALDVQRADELKLCAAGGVAAACLQILGSCAHPRPAAHGSWTSR